MSSSIEFKLLAPYNKAAALIGSFSDWKEISMLKDESGYFRTSIELEDGIYQYKFRVQSKSWSNEPDEWVEINDLFQAADSHQSMTGSFISCRESLSSSRTAASSLLILEVQLMKYKYSLQEARQIGRPGVPGYAYSSKEDFEGASAGIFSTEQRHGRIKNVRSDAFGNPFRERLYLILEGQGELIVGDEVIPVAKDDVLIIPKNTEYDYQGQLRLFLVHIPAYEEGSDINIEPPPSQ